MSTEQPWVEGSPPPESRSLEEWRALASEVETAQDSELDALVLRHLSTVVFPSANAHRREELVAQVPATAKRLLLTSLCARMAEKLETAHLGWDGLEDTLPGDDSNEDLRSGGQEFGIRAANRERPKDAG